MSDDVIYIIYRMIIWSMGDVKGKLAETTGEHILKDMLDKTYV